MEANSPKKQILFVDDDEINLFVLKRNFQEDFDVLTAPSGTDAIEVIEQQKGKLHALITDMGMPDITGLEVIEKMKSELSGVPCFLLTGYDRNPEIDAALAAQTIQKVFKKPFNIPEIKEALIESAH